MKAIPKTLITWLFSLFNVGMYNVSDELDSLVALLHVVGLSKQADTILSLSETIEYQQQILIVLDGFKCLCMAVSLIVLMVTNADVLRAAYYWSKRQFYRTLSFIGTQINHLINRI